MILVTVINWSVKNIYTATYLALAIIILMGCLRRGGLFEGMEDIDGDAKLEKLVKKMGEQITPPTNQPPFNSSDNQLVKTLSATEDSGTLPKSSAEGGTGGNPGGSPGDGAGDGAEEAKTGGEKFAQSQRDTYRLNDTVKQLQDVVEGLAPTIREGKKIMTMFEQLKL